MTSDTSTVVAMIVSVVGGLAICFFGLKIYRVLCVLYGAIFGVAIGLLIANAADVGTAASVGIVLVCAVILGALFFLLKRVAVFLMVFFACLVISAYLMLPNFLSQLVAGVDLTQMNLELPIVIALAVSLLLAILAAIFMEPLIIIITAIQGGLAVGSAVVPLVGLPDINILTYGIGVVLAILGLIVQFSMHSRKIAKKERKAAERVRDQSSVENDVEQARSMLDDEDEDDYE